MFSFKPMDQESAQAIVSWSYPAPYATYDIPVDERAGLVAQMLDPKLRFYAVHRGKELVGFCSFGRDGQVKGWTYDTSATDVGAGLRPDRVGQKLGQPFLNAIMLFAREELGLHPLRATIASWNDRALRAATNAGFIIRGAFTAPWGIGFTVLTTHE